MRPPAKQKLQRFLPVTHDVDLVGQVVLAQGNEGQLHVIRIVLDQQDFNFGVGRWGWGGVQTLIS